MRLGLKAQHAELTMKLSRAQQKALSAKTQWNVQLQHVGKGKTALRYLAPYVKRSGFTNKRLIGYSNDHKHVLLAWTNSNNGKPGVLRLSIHEFIRRWLQHVLPKGFSRVRHYGYFSAAAKKTRLLIRAMLGEIGEPAAKMPEPQAHRCPHCDGKLQFLRALPRLTPYRGPP